MSEPFNHHYVSKFFQRNFANERGCLYYFDKRCPSQGIREKRPKAIFSEEHLNSVERKDGTRDTSLEKWYSLLESKAAPVVRRIVVAAESQKLPLLTHAEREIWYNFVYHQQKRPPDTFARLGLVETLPKDLLEFIAAFEREHRPLTKKERLEFLSEDGTQRIAKMASVVARGKGSQDVIDVLASRGLAIAWISPPDVSFVLGDHPMARMGTDANLAGTELWFPISSLVAVSPFGNANTEYLVPFDKQQVQRVNKVIYEQSNTVASRSKPVLGALIGL